MAEAVGDVAANLAARSRAPLAGESAANPLLKHCFEAMGEASGEAQDTAAAALAQVGRNMEFRL